jgi:hypothetical protein
VATFRASPSSSVNHSRSASRAVAISFEGNFRSLRVPPTFDRSHTCTVKPMSINQSGSKISRRKPAIEITRIIFSQQNINFFRSYNKFVFWDLFCFMSDNFSCGLVFIRQILE